MEGHGLHKRGLREGALLLGSLSPVRRAMFHFVPPLEVQLSITLVLKSASPDRASEKNNTLPKSQGVLRQIAFESCKKYLQPAAKQDMPYIGT